MKKSFSFGDLCRYQGEDYIFLHSTPQLIYLGKILDSETSRIVDRKSNGPSIQHRNTGGPRFCFVKLKTEDFRDRCAMLSIPAKDLANILLDNLEGSLIPEDIDRIKEEIITSPAPAGELKEFVKSLG